MEEVGLLQGEVGKEGVGWLQGVEGLGVAVVTPLVVEVMPQEGEERQQEGEERQQGEGVTEQEMGAVVM